MKKHHHEPNQLISMTQSNTQSNTMSDTTLANQAKHKLPNIGERIQYFRKKHTLTLDTLAQKSGVSKSMLSQIERDLSNPTIAVLWKLASALNITIHELLEATPNQTPILEKLNQAQTPTMQAVDAGYQLRILNPMRLTAHIEWYELILQPGGQLVSQAHEVGTIEHLSVIQGMICVDVANQQHKLNSGETLRYAADVSHCLDNPSKQLAKAILLVEYAMT